MSDVLLAFAPLILAAAIVEGVVEFVFSPAMEAMFPKDEEGNARLRTLLLTFIAIVLGISIALDYGFGLLKTFNLPVKFPILDNILTGILIGRGSNFMHQFVSKFIPATENRRV